MINALYEPFPESITVDGKEYQILTDFREWLRFSDMMSDRSVPAEHKLRLMTEWLEEVPPVINAELIYAVLDFYKASDLEPDSTDYEDDDPPEETERPPLLDWKFDAKFIIGDFRRCYGIDLLTTEYMHWWEFRCLLAALPEDSAVQRRIAYRSVDISQIKSPSEQMRILKIQRQIAIPFEYDDDMIAAALERTML